MGGKRLDPALKKRFLERLDAVGSVSVVARELGLNRNTAFALAYKAGIKVGHQRHPRRESMSSCGSGVCPVEKPPGGRE